MNYITIARANRLNALNGLSRRRVNIFCDEFGTQGRRHVRPVDLTALGGEHQFAA